MSVSMQDARVYELLHEAARWRLLARLFECPNDQWRCDVDALVREVDDAALRAIAQSALAGASEGQYHSVFGPGGPAPPREVSYHDTVELGSLMSELAAYYDGFGYRHTTGEPPDHIAAETGFVAYLRLKEAHAAASGDVEHSQMAAEAAARFCADHLAVYAAPLAGLLADSEIDYLVRASRLLADRAGKPPSRTRLPVIQNVADEDGSEFPCCDR